MVRLICAGYPKTGTKSLTKALHILGYTNVHDYLEHIDIHMDEYEKYFAGKQPISKVLDQYEDMGVDVTVDMPPSFLFEDFHKRWPNAKVILTIRNEDDWFKSIRKMNMDTFTKYHWLTYFSKTALRFEEFSRNLYQYMLGSGLENSWLWKMHYRRHNAYVPQVIPEKNLLIFKVDDGWGPLCKFLGKKVPDEEFPFLNAAGSKGNIIERLFSETNIAKSAIRQTVFSIVALILLVVVAYLIYLQVFENHPLSTFLS